MILARLEDHLALDYQLAVAGQHEVALTGEGLLVRVSKVDLHVHGVAAVGEVVSTVVHPADTLDDTTLDGLDLLGIIDALRVLALGVIPEQTEGREVLLMASGDDIGPAL